MPGTKQQSSSIKNPSTNGSKTDPPSQTAPPAPSQIRRASGIYAVVWIVMVCLFGWNPFNPNSDLFAHAAVGHWMVEHHAIPTHSLFLWSTNQSWIAHSWLSELLAFVAMSFGPILGPTLCMVTAIVLCSAVFLILWFSRNPSEPVPWTLPILFACGILACSGRFLARPESFSFLFVAVTIVFLIRYLKRRGRLSPASSGLLSPLEIALMALMFALWANLHGGVMNGLALVGLAFLCEAIQYRFDKGARQLGLLFLLCAAAIILNPYGIRYYTIYSQVHSAVFQNITEWLPIYTPPIVAWQILLCTGLLTVASLALLLRRPWRWTLIAWWLYGLLTFVEARRNIMIFIPVCLMILISYQTEILALESRLRARFAMSAEAKSPLLRWLPLVVQILLLLEIAVNAEFVTRPNRFALVSPLSLPDGQANYMLMNHITGKVFNDYFNASYMEWRLYGHNTFFIDAMNAYGNEVMDKATLILSGNPQGMALLDQYGVNCVIGRLKAPSDPDYPALYYQLGKDPNWALVYMEKDGPIWMRKLPAYRSLWINAHLKW